MDEVQERECQLLEGTYYAKQHQDSIVHQLIMDNEMTTMEFKLFSMLKPKLYRDGNKWCCLLGENIIVGIVGFGDSPYKAIIEWNQAFHKL